MCHLLTKYASKTGIEMYNHRKYTVLALTLVSISEFETLNDVLIYYFFH